MHGQIQFNRDVTFVTEALVKAIAAENQLVLSKRGSRMIRLHSAAGIDPFFSAIEQHDYYIDLTCTEKDQKSTLRYRIRGNSTYLTFGLVFCIYSIPFLLFVLTAYNDDTGKNELLIVFAGYLLFVGFILLVIGRKQKRLADQGMKVFQSILKKLENICVQNEHQGE